MRRILLYAAGGVVALWAATAAYVFWLMHRPPEEFAKGFGRLPTAAMVALPFEPMWLRARTGVVKPGDRAPEIELAGPAGGPRIKVGAPNGRPALLVFGSYT